MYISISLILTNLAIKGYTELHRATLGYIKATKIYDTTHGYMRLHWVTGYCTRLHEATLRHYRGYTGLHEAIHKLT